MIASIPTIDPATVKQWLDQHEAVIIDVREPEEYAALHIAGATLNTSFTSPDGAVGTGYTLGQTGDDNGFWGRSEHRIQTSAGSIAATFTAGTAGEDWLTHIATFKAAAAGAAAEDFTTSRAFGGGLSRGFFRMGGR